MAASFHLSSIRLLGPFILAPVYQRQIKGRRILQIDYVLTTGAKVEACAKALLREGTRAVDVAVVARVRTVENHPI